MTKPVYSKKEKAAALLLFLSNILIFLTFWLDRNYDEIYFDQFLFNLKSTTTGVHSALVGSAVLYIGGISIPLTVLEILIYQVITGRRKLGRLGSEEQSDYGFAAFLKRHTLSVVSVFLALAVAVLAVHVKLYSYIRTDSMDSNFIEKHYVRPDSSLLTFPEQKKNLIYIFLESMESTYADPDVGEMITDCYIPELKTLAQENVNFSHRDGLGGALSFPGTTWTAAAMVTQSSGVVVKVSLEADSYGAGDVFLPGAVSIGEILEEQGYHQVLLLGSNAEFHGREVFFTKHGNYEILDTDSLKAASRLDEDYNEWWGFEDEKLFAYAKEELTRLSEEGRPFNFTMLTADTHFPDGYKCALCRDDYDSQYANVLACSSRQVAEFVAWIQAQPFYEDTVIVISGDHLTMDAGFMNGIDPDYTRTIYNCFIHAAQEPVLEKNRRFGTFDLFPTTLAAMGVKIEGNRLALGTNLFSDQRTLTEQFGYEYLAEELQKQSDFYDEELLMISSDRESSD